MTAPNFNTNLPRSTLSHTIPIANGFVSGATVGTGSAQVIAANPDRRKITFHNPNITDNSNIFVCPSVDKDGNALTAGDGQPGSVAIFAGASVTFDGECQSAYKAAASAAAQGLTIIESQVPSQS